MSYHGNGVDFRLPIKDWGLKKSDKKRFFLFTDGSCFPNPGVGGYGWLLLDGAGEYVNEGSGGGDNETNNTMEMTALIEGLKAIVSPSEVIVYSDSKYVVNGTNSWAETWAQKRINDRANMRLWLEVVELKQIHSVTAWWVKGHNGNEWNEYVDDIANRVVTNRHLELYGTEPSWKFH